MKDTLRQISEYLGRGDAQKVGALTGQAIDEKISPREILDQGLIGGMNVVGQKYKAHEIFLPQVLLAAKAMYAGMDVLKPMFLEGGMPTAGKVVIGSVQGDLHDIGKNLVAMMMESSGLEVHNLGVDIAPEQFVAAVKERKAEILCLSALLTTTTPMMKLTVDAAVESGIRDQVKILVGGAPVTQKYADDIGADGYAPDAGSATKLVKKLIR
jgi:5-methyltetrahydrofolate--homocysteine methyltransferase